MIDFQIENGDLKNQQLNQHFYFENWLMIAFQKRNAAINIGPTRNAFSLKEIAIFFKIAPIKNHQKLYDPGNSNMWPPLSLAGPERRGGGTPASH